MNLTLRLWHVEDSGAVFFYLVVENLAFLWIVCLFSLIIERFLFKSNAGALYSELKDIASGGEISRVMLSIKSILSSYTQLSSIIFDEIDSFIGR